MAVTASQVEEIATWCRMTADLTEERQQARRRFFDDETRGLLATGRAPVTSAHDCVGSSESAGWVATRGGFILPYDAVGTAADPAAALLAFLRSTYDVAADLAVWDRPLLEERAPCGFVPLPSPSRVDRRPR